MANHVDYDTDKRIIYVTTAPTLVDGDWTVDLDVKIDLYSDMKEDWKDNNSLNKFYFPMRSVGGDDLPGSKQLGATFFLASDWKIRPYESSHVFKVNGNLYSEDGTSPFTQTSGTYNIMVINTVSSLVDSTVAQLSEIEYASFNGGVTINTVTGSAGTDYPIGTLQEPVDNLADALTIAAERGFNKLYINSDMTLDGNIDNFLIQGESHVNIQVIIASGANASEVTIQECDISGTLDGGTSIERCVITDLDYVNGHIHHSALQGKITLAGNDDALIVDCNQADMNTEPEIDMGGSGQDLVVVNFSGILHISNMTANSAGIGLNGGQVVLENTVTGGLIHVSGIGRLVDSVGDDILTGTWNGATIINELVSVDYMADAVWNKDITEFNTSGSMGYSFRTMLGLQQHNFRLRDQIYQQISLGNNNFKWVLTSGTIRVYDSASDADNDINPFAEYSIVATYDSNGNCTSYKSTLV